MAGKVASYAKKDETLAKLVTEAPFPTIRLMNGGPKPVWQEATAENVPRFSAILFAFGDRLNRDLDVPIGLIVGAVGGTPSGSWMPSETFASSEKVRVEVAEFAKTWNRANAEAQHQKRLAAWEASAEKAKAEGQKPRGKRPQAPVDPGSMTRGGEQGGLFDRFIRTSVGYGIRGVLWDQGEAGSGILGLDQYTSMTELIRGWRNLWGQGDFPFLFVQKPSGGGNAWSTDDPITREANAFTAQPNVSRIGSGEQRFLYTRLMLENENAWMVPTIDLGSMVHPINKWGYGNRAAQVAEQKVYQLDSVEAFGPIYESHSIEGSQVTIQFSHTGGGLKLRHADKLQGFALAGGDGRWHWATAEISGKKRRHRFERRRGIAPTRSFRLRAGSNLGQFVQ